MGTEKNCPHCGKPVGPNALHGLCPECMLKVGLYTQSPSEASAATGGRFVPPSPEQLASHFPQLEILELLGQGGMGAVYKARQPALDRFVALKILPPQTATDPGFAERFTREARALAKLSHPNIVAVHDFGQSGGFHYFIMEFVDGVDLRQVERAGKLTPREALQIIPQICEALQFAHDEGIVHRDIKPENILVDRKGRVKIADFGLAKILGREAQNRTLTGARDVMGTPHYMAPEQIEKPAEVDHRADIYSLGVVFYEMLTGELPLGKFQPPSKKVEVDVRLDEVVLRALEKEPERRYQQASVLKTQVETIAATPPRRAAVSPAPVDGTAKNKSPMARLVEILFNETFTSPLAIKLVNISALGFLASLALLGFVPVPGMHRCFGFSGFSGFFGLIGFAFLVEFAERRKKSGTPTDGAGAAQGLTESHFSRPAIVGACWAPFFFLMALAAFRSVRVEVVPGQPPLGPAVWQVLLQLTLLPLGLLAPFGTTILGWIAVTQIRRSAGRLYGLGLAVFDGLFFPLLLLDTLIGLLAVIVGKRVMPGVLDQIFDSFLVGFTAVGTVLAVLLLVDFVVVRTIWRAVNQPSRMAASPKPEYPKQPPSRTRGPHTFPDKAPYFSRTVIAGAVLVALAILLTPFAPTPSGFWKAVNMQQDSQVITVCYGGAWLASAIAGTLVGWVGISQIRRSAGRLYGLGLAVFDGLLFPLLALDALIFWLTYLVVSAIAQSFSSTSATEAVSLGIEIGYRMGVWLAVWLTSATLISVLVDFLLVRRVWRAVRKPLDGVQPTTLPAGSRPALCSPVFLAGAGIVLALGSGLALWLYSVSEPPGPTPPLDLSAIPGRRVPPGAAFGPVTERVIAPGRKFDLDTGRQVSLFGSGADLSASETRLVSLGMFVLRWDSGVWDLPASEITERFGGRTDLPQTREELDPGPITYVFKTRQGSLGMLQFDGFTDSPRGARIRYKVVRDSATKAQLATESPKQISFDPVTERVVSGEGDANKRFIDFDSGKQFAATEFFGPKDEPSPEQTQQFWHKTGVDAVGDTSPAIRGLIGFEMVATPVPSEEWERPTPARLNYYFTLAQPGTPVTISGKGELPATFFIKTREGGAGLLQITGFTDNPPGVKLRYKLVLDSATKAQFVAESLPNISFGPVIECVLEPGEKFDLDTGSSPSLLGRGADLTAGEDKLFALDMFVMWWDSSAWELPATEITERFGSSKWGAKSRQGRQELDVVSSTYVFRTREGGLGMLQFETIPVQPRGVKIRYKLVQRAAAVPSTQKTALTAEQLARGEAGWFLAGSHPKDYETSTDRDNTHSGKPSAYLKSNVPNPSGFGTLMQMFKADAYRGKRVRLSGYVRSKEVAKWAGLWLRVDGQKTEPLAFDNMQDRPIKGTSDWTRHEIVLDVAEQAEKTAFGVLLAGGGQVWINDLNFEIVGKDVPATGANLSKAMLQAPKSDFDK